MRRLHWALRRELPRLGVPLGTGPRLGGRHYLGPAAGPAARV